MTINFCIEYIPIVMLVTMIMVDGEVIQYRLEKHCTNLFVSLLCAVLLYGLVSLGINKWLAFLVCFFLFVMMR